MAEVLVQYPGAQRALFRRYHIGGCSSCGFSPEETVESLCARNQILNVQEVLAHIRASHQNDLRLLVEPNVVKGWLDLNDAKLLDIRAREEFETSHIQVSILLTQSIMNEIMGKWDRASRIVIVDHLGKTVLDAAAYFQGHGFQQIYGLKGGIDAWSIDIDASVRRYRLEA